MRSRQTQLFGAIGIVALVGALAGCGGEQVSGGSGSAAPAAASSSSDAGGSDAGGASDSGGAESGGRTEGLPPENEALKAPDKGDYLEITYPTEQGAKVAAQYFIDAMYYGYATGDAGPLESMSDLASCVECNELIDDIRSWRDSGKYLSPANVTLDDEWVVDKNDDLTKVEYWFTVDALRVQQKDSTVKTVAENQTASAFHLSFDDDSWKVLACRWEKADDFQE